MKKIKDSILNGLYGTRFIFYGLGFGILFRIVVTLLSLSLTPLMTILLPLLSIIVATPFIIMLDNKFVSRGRKYKDIDSTNVSDKVRAEQGRHQYSTFK